MNEYINSIMVIMLKSFTHHHVVPDPYDFLSSEKHKKYIFFVEFSPIPPHNDSLLWLIKTLVIAMISLVFVVPNQHFGGALDEGKTAETEQECVGLSV